MITYFDTSMLIKLLVQDEANRSVAERLWMDSDYVVCAEIGYVEARAGLAAAHRGLRLGAVEVSAAKAQLELLWQQVRVMPVDGVLVNAAGDLAEDDGLRGYDAVHLAGAMAAEASVVASSDNQLAEAARRRGFAVSPPR